MYALAAEPCNSEADGSLPLLPLSPAHLILINTKTKSKAKTKAMIRTLTPARKCSKLFYLEFGPMPFPIRLVARKLRWIRLTPLLLEIHYFCGLDPPMDCNHPTFEAFATCGDAARCKGGEGINQTKSAAACTHFATFGHIWFGKNKSSG